MRAIFLDRDGVINVYRTEHVRSLVDFEYYAGTDEAFAILGALGLPLVVVTNQSGIGRGYMSAEAVAEIHDRLRSDAAAWRAPIAAIETCPHAPAASCVCRKPSPFLFERAAARLSVQLRGSYLVGDAPSDIEVGSHLGMVTLRVATGRGSEPGPPADCSVPDLLAAARRIRVLLGSAPNQNCEETRARPERTPRADAD